MLQYRTSNYLFRDLLLWSKIGTVTTSSLSANSGLSVIGGKTDTTDLLAVEFLFNKSNEGWVHFSITSSSSKSKDEMEGAFLLDVIVGEGSSIFKLLTSEDQTLLIRGDSFLVLDFLLHSLDLIARFNV